MNATPFARLRMEAELTQAEVARRIGTSTNTVSAWERSISSPRANFWQALAVIYGVETSDIAEAVLQNTTNRPTLNAA